MTQDAFAICAKLLTRLSAEADVIAVLRAGSRLHQQLGCLVPDARLFCLFAPTADGILPDGSFGEWELVASGQDIDTPPSTALPWPHAQHPPRRQRRLDTLFPRHRDVGLIVTQDPGSAADLLRGAQNIIGAAAPAVVIDLSSLPLGERLNAWLAAAEVLGSMFWHDALLQPCPVSAAVIESFGHSVVAALPKVETSVQAAQQSASGCTPPVAAVQGLPKKFATVFDSRLCCRGFFPMESDGEKVWRWSGNGAVCAFALACPGPGIWQLTLDVADWGVVAEPHMLGVSVGGVALGIRSVSRWRICFSEITVPPNADDGRLVIWLSTPRPRKRRADDAHAVGIALLQASLELVGPC